MISPLSETILREINSRRLPGLPIDAEMVAPHYEGLGIANIPASIANWLALEAPSISALDRRIAGKFAPAYRQVILLVMDALGWEKFQQLSQLDTPENELLARLVPAGNVFPLTSVVPSTTSAALTTYWTGVTPSTHGITGYEMWMQEYGVVANMILQMPASFLFGPGNLASAGFTPDQFLNIPALGTMFKKQGVASYAFQPEAINGSGLSQSLLANVESMPYTGLPELWQTLEHMLAQPASRARYFYIYWPNLDGWQHMYGPDDDHIREEYFIFMREMLRFLERARRNGRGDTLLLMTADHGMLPTARPPEAEIRRYPELLSMLHLLPTGEARMPYLYLKPGFEQKALDLIETLFPGQFIPVDSQKAVDSGLFGPAPYHPKLITRLGDVILLARDNHFLYWQNKENMMNGRHGGMSRQEMLVPLLVLPI